MVWVAFADESMRQRRDAAGLYAIAALVVDSSLLDDLRSHATTLGRGKQVFHWRDASSADRRRAVQIVAEFNALHYVVVGVGLEKKRQERHRRQVLRRTLWELDQVNVDRIVLDSRRQPQDAADQAAVAAWRAQKIIRSRLRADHASATVRVVAA